jgi:hypothetical protein
LVPVTHKFNDALLIHMFKSPEGAVAKDLLKRGARVQSRARKNLGGLTGSGPKRVNTGLLRASVAVALVPHGGRLAVRIGTGVYYALYVHDGTGLYGPKHKLIYPRTARVLVFRSKTYGVRKGKYAGKVFARFVRGMRPNPFLKNALPAFKN